MKKNIFEMNDREYKEYRNARIAKRNKTILTRNIIFCTLITISLFIILGCFTSRASEEKKIKVSKYYTCANLEYDQTVADLAQEYFESDAYCNMEYYDNVTSYLDEINSINHLSDDTVINGGKLIYIPYYLEEENIKTN